MTMSSQNDHDVAAVVVVVVGVAGVASGSVVVEAKQATLVAILCFIKPKIISWHQKKQKASTASQVTDKQQPICS